ncbi:hypothetical protein [Sporosarcina sp. E16_8]|uniref:hypothetical protein n=1 Tax=Sporosarcina sp. E16_8 TaxID=2789295 RepID=UPI001A93610C|nr:hypothetical protein [Sporosarcina sp. E16_8]MBO0586451.1 hypothetical protein [Sporosarcina sp. E16_8]
MTYKYSSEWNSDIKSVSGASRVIEYLSERKEIETYTAVPLVETENYYYMINRKFNGGAQVLIIRKATGEMRLSNGEVDPRASFTIVGDSLHFVSYYLSDFSGTAISHTVFQKLLNPDGTATEKYVSLKNPFTIITTTRDYTTGSNDYFDESGNLVIEAGYQHNSTKLVSKCRYKVTPSGQGITADVILGSNAATFDVRGSGMRREPSRRLRGDWQFAGDGAVRSVNAGGITEVTGPFGTRTLAVWTDVEGYTKLLDKPRNEEHENTRGRFGVYLVNQSQTIGTIITCGHDGASDTFQLKHDESHVHWSDIQAIDSKNNVYWYGVGAGNVRAFKKVSPNGNVLWSLPIGTFVFDLRFIEKQKKMLVITFNNSWLPGPNLHCIDTETGELIWSYSGLTKARSQQLSAYLNSPMLLLDIYDEVEKKLKPKLLAQTGSTYYSEKSAAYIPYKMEMVSVVNGELVICERMPMHPKYLAT